MDSVLDPAGQGAEAISTLWWVMLWLSLIPIAIVAGALGRILWRRRRESAEGAERPAPDVGISEGADRRVIVLGGIVLPILLLIPVAMVTVATGQSREPDGDAEALEVSVTGQQFWWDVRYPPPGEDSLDAGAPVRTANEIHVPVGRPVELVLESNDVIHSFWVPEIDGKMDLIPGRTNRLRVQADRPGVYQGRCAEFCGLGHTVMRVMVVALEEDEFEQWHRDLAEPIDPETVDSGLREELANSCAPCHTMRGLYEEEPEAFTGEFGPDLTHLAERRTLGAGALPNTRANLGRWILDAPGVKPGSRMPKLDIDGADLNDIVDFLGRERR